MGPPPHPRLGMGARGAEDVRVRPVEGGGRLTLAAAGGEAVIQRVTERLGVLQPWGAVPPIP